MFGVIARALSRDAPDITHPIMAVEPADPLMRAQSLIRCSTNLKLLPSAQAFSVYASRVFPCNLKSWSTLVCQRDHGCPASDSHHSPLRSNDETIQ